MLVHASPHEAATATRGMDSPDAFAAVTSVSPMTAHSPPPEGTKKFTRPAVKKAKAGSVPSGATATMPCAICVARLTEPSGA